MHQIVALADEEVRRVMRSVSADVQASLALSRAMLKAVAAMSPMGLEAASQALQDEVDMARRLAAPQRVVDLIEDARAGLDEVAEDGEEMSVLQRALLAAAAATPDLPGEDDVDLLQPQSAFA